MHSPLVGLKFAIVNTALTALAAAPAVPAVAMVQVSETAAQAQMTDHVLITLAAIIGIGSGLLQGAYSILLWVRFFLAMRRERRAKREERG